MRVLTDQVVWLHEFGAYRHLGYDSDDTAIGDRRENYEGYSDAEWLSHWSHWSEWDHTIEYFDKHDRPINPTEVDSFWEQVAYAQVRPEPGIAVRGRSFLPNREEG